jgi:hypothetical protein
MKLMIFLKQNTVSTQYYITINIIVESLVMDTKLIQTARELKKITDIIISSLQISILINHNGEPEAKIRPQGSGKRNENNNNK